MDIPGISGLSASLSVLNGILSGWTVNLGSSFFDNSTWNGPLVSLVSAVLL